MKALSSCSDEELLASRFCDLRIKLKGLKGKFVTKALASLHNDLAAKGFRFRPHVWLSEEWFCPDGVPGFAIPFYLAHPRLRRLEARQMLEVEGGTLFSCVRIMRHETGHAIDNAYRLRRRRRRQRLFGSPRTVYPEFYAPKPFSRRYVRHLEPDYAQSHPDEDFAETFAVWLDPSSHWRERYEEWPALEKLLYIDELMRELAPNEPVVVNDATPEELSSLTHTLGEHYRRERELHKVDFAQHYDSDLKKIFAGEGAQDAASFLKRHRAFLRRQIARWTQIRQYTVDEVVKDWIDLAGEKKLALRWDEARSLQDVIASLTVRVMQYFQSGRYRVAL